MAASTPSSLLCLLLMISTFSSIGTTTAADVPPTAPVAPSTACNPTPYPSFCRSSVLPGNSSANLYDFGRLTITRSLSAALRFSSLVNSYLGRASSLTPTATRALQDCQLLSGLNIDYLSSARASLNPTQTLPDAQADEVQSLLAANGLSVPLSNGTKLYSVGLSLFTRAWVSKRTRGAGGGARGRFHKGRNVRAGLVRDGKLAARMSHAHRKVYESLNGRTLLQTSDSVAVSDVVVVSQDGTGNFTTITDALNAAPNDTSVDDGYFLIYVTAGVYEEYVTVTKHKKYVMVVGDGINQTIITGNRSVGDGWTTFNSATVCEYHAPLLHNV
ncbi:putative pectinesterase/pectinesterase inhibitor 20 [Acorus calamus]|uniref:Pectinesterase/pectinesterase inhibitor 20 n=1 Tax=Acorus calamus TaxID=4465 RepID=A0AAV9D1B0_ACOCL|nr:putative pectinesterase/pectinesterase inhibitor 20 [Acorus calamus]